MTPDRQPDPAARTQDPVRLGDGAGSGAPDTAETGNDVEGFVVPRQGVHIADPQISIWAAVFGNVEESRRRIDACAERTAQPCQFHRQARSAGDIE